MGCRHPESEKISDNHITHITLSSLHLSQLLNGLALSEVTKTCPHELDAV